jgi:hypothetical protein
MIGMKNQRRIKEGLSVRLAEWYCMYFSFYAEQQLSS